MYRDPRMHRHNRPRYGGRGFTLRRLTHLLRGTVALTVERLTAEMHYWETAFSGKRAVTPPWARGFEVKPEYDRFSQLLASKARHAQEIARVEQRGGQF